MIAYYNEFDRWPAAKLKRLIDQQRITHGHVDTRSIKDVQPAEIIEFDRVHLFAGIAGWEEALRLAGWPEGCPVWTGSCPCQPFSSAGRGKGTDDERHLWPEMFRLIDACRPCVVFGEQVASPGGLAWLDGVFDDLEGAGYTCRAADLCSAGIGSPHIRQRLYWVAYAEHDGSHSSRRTTAQPHSNGQDKRILERDSADCCGLGNTIFPRLEGHTRHVSDGGQPGRIGAHQAGPVAEAGSNGRLAYAEGIRGEQTTVHASGSREGGIQKQGSISVCGGTGESRVGQHPSPLDLDWRNVDWLLCRDGKWRPVESGTFPLAHGISERVGRLKAYGNAIDPRVAAWFIASVMPEIFTQGPTP